MQRGLNMWRRGDTLSISGPSLAEGHMANSKRSTCSQFSNSIVRNEPEFGTATTLWAPPPAASAHAKMFPWTGVKFSHLGTGLPTRQPAREREASKGIDSCMRQSMPGRHTAPTRNELHYWPIFHFSHYSVRCQSRCWWDGQSSRCLKRKAKKNLDLRMESMLSSQKHSLAGNRKKW